MAKATEFTSRGLLGGLGMIPKVPISHRAPAYSQTKTDLTATAPNSVQLSVDFGVCGRALSWGRRHDPHGHEKEVGHL
jgi:hypothetical protein